MTFAAGFILGLINGVTAGVLIAWFFNMGDEDEPEQVTPVSPREFGFGVHGSDAVHEMPNTGLHAGLPRQPVLSLVPKQPACPP